MGPSWLRHMQLLLTELVAGFLFKLFFDLLFSAWYRGHRYHVQDPCKRVALVLCSDRSMFVASFARFTMS